MMNKKAEELGLVNTHFVTPHGLDNDNHYTTAYELSLLTDYALNNQTFLNFVSCKTYTVTINGTHKTITNTNELLGNLNGIYGVKTGFTNGANRCLVTACKRNDLDIICVVLGADTKRFRTQDSIKLIEHIYKEYQMIDLEQIVNNSFDEWQKINIEKFSINKGTSKNISLGIKDFSYKFYPVKKEDVSSITTSINCDFNLNAPINKGTSVGNFIIKINNEEVLKYDIVNLNAIGKKGSLNYLQEFLTNFFKYLTIHY